MTLDEIRATQAVVQGMIDSDRERCDPDAMRADLQILATFEIARQLARANDVALAAMESCAAFAPSVAIEQFWKNLRAGIRA